MLFRFAMLLRRRKRPTAYGVLIAKRDLPFAFAS